jgi:hypothetical protein
MNRAETGRVAGRDREVNDENQLTPSISLSIGGAGIWGIDQTLSANSSLPHRFHQDPLQESKPCSVSR